MFPKNGRDFGIQPEWSCEELATRQSRRDVRYNRRQSRAD